MDKRNRLVDLDLFTSAENASRIRWCFAKRMLPERQIPMTPDPLVETATRRDSLRVATAFIVVLAVCALGAVLTVLRTVVTPLLIGLLLLLLVNPFVSMLDARYVPRWLTYLLLFVIGSTAVVGVEQLIQIQGNEFMAKLPEYKKRSSTALDKYARTFGMADGEGHFDTSKFGLQDASSGKQDQLVSPLLRAGMEVLELCTMALFYLLFGLAESRRFSKRLECSLSDESASELSSVISSIQNDIWHYLWTKTAISFGLGVTTAALGWVFALDFWLLWGFLMFLANYITYIGSMIAIIPPIVVAFAQFDNFSAAVGLSVLLVVARLIWIDYAEMRFSGKQVNVSPLLVLFAVALMGWMWGAVGMLLAVPLLTVARVVLGRFPQTRYVASLISDLEE
jgi:AI-2 transport protein TqsA